MHKQLFHLQVNFRAQIYKRPFGIWNFEAQSPYSLLWYFTIGMQGLFRGKNDISAIKVIGTLWNLFDKMFHEWAYQSIWFQSNYWNLHSVQKGFILFFCVENKKYVWKLKKHFSFAIWVLWLLSWNFRSLAAQCRIGCFWQFSIC